MSATSFTLNPPRLSAVYSRSRSFFRTAATERPSRSAIKLSDALLSMDQSRWFSSASVQRGALGRHRSNAAARFLTEYRDQVGWYCRMALPAARRPPRAHAAFRTSSNSAVHWQVFPLGLPTFRPFLRPGDLSRFRNSGSHIPVSNLSLYPRWALLIRQPVVVPVSPMPLITPSCALKPPLSSGSRPACLSTEISSSRSRKSDCGSPGTMNLSTVGGRTCSENWLCVARTGT